MKQHLVLLSLFNTFLHGLFWRFPKKYLSQRWNSNCTRAFHFWPWLWLQDGWACRWRKKKCAVAQFGDENFWDSTMGYVFQVFLGDCVNFPHFWLRLPFVIFGPKILMSNVIYLKCQNASKPVTRRNVTKEHSTHYFGEYEHYKILMVTSFGTFWLFYKFYE